MIPRYCILWILIALATANKILAQTINRYNTFSYNVNEGMLQSTISDLSVDKNNFCWIAYPNGIQQFDGNNFKHIPVQPGLPDDKYIRFFRCANGDLLLSHSKGISKYVTAENRFVVIFQKNPSFRHPLSFAGEDDGQLYLYDEMGMLTALNSANYAVTGSVKTGMPPFVLNAENNLRFSDNIIDHCLAWWFDNTICLWDLKNKKLLYQTPALNARSVYLLHLLPERKVIFSNYLQNDALQIWDFKKAAQSTLPISGKDKDHYKYISRFNMLKWNGTNIVSINNRLYETDSTLLRLKSEIVNFQNQPVAGTLGIAKMVQDNLGNLYIQTITGGIRKIIRSNYPIKYYGSLQKEFNAVIGVLADKKNNRILVGTSGSGLFIYDTLQQLVRHIPTLPGHKLSFGVNAMVKDSKGDYILFVTGDKYTWKLRSDLSAITSQPIMFSNIKTSAIDYFGSTIYRNDKEAVVQSMYQLFRTDLSSGQTNAYRLTSAYTLGRLWYNGKIISHQDDQLIFLDAQSLQELKRVRLSNTAGVRCYATGTGGQIFLGTNNGLFCIDSSGKLLYHLNREKGLPDDCIYAVGVDKNGNLWCSSNKGIFRIGTDNKIFQLTREDGLQENEFNTGVIAVADDGEMFFGGMNGVSSFYPDAIRNFDEPVNLFITRIRVNNEEVIDDAAPWLTKKLVLNYNENAVSFDFVAMANKNPAQYIYQYKMAGIDKEWIQNSGLQTIRYSLPPGKYTLQLYASRSFDSDARPMKEIRIVIRPPFWKTWWFMVLCGLVAAGLLVYIINQRNKRKYARQLQQLEQERRLKQERERISKDLHDSLGAYAQVMLYKTELLEQNADNPQKLLSDLKFVSKDIITSLRETVWALKKDQYLAEDCLLRIRNFVQPFMRYYEDIQFSVEGEAPQGMWLHYTRALNAVRMVQEAVSNSIKHASPTQVKVQSETIHGRWKITVTDDGMGFDSTRMSSGESGNGLHNMKYRAAESGFDLIVESEPQKGTVITIII